MNVKSTLTLTAKDLFHSLLHTEHVERKMQALTQWISGAPLKKTMSLLVAS